ncbi:GNAT family N-acetyltransferase [Thioalkalivibrio sp. AKL7]|uniref:GNAT family N-acetyltransferase n=1 Tax=Thioalkalivibrio sp. AKL7 TaxID=1158155 RepID=UPI0003603229|nr:GNAT family N-acetyltransferase [Thioalkalivibrio sp. AKL7]
MVDLVYRTATPGDVEDIARLVNSAYRPSTGDEGWTHESLLLGGQRTNPMQIGAAMGLARIILALDDGRIVGCVQVDVKGREAHIGMLAVAPGMQAKGIGNSLLVRAEAWASTVPGVEVFVLVVVSARRELVQYYLRRGYAEAGNRLPYPVDAGVGDPLHAALDLTVLRKCSNTRLQPTSGPDAAFPG